MSGSTLACRPACGPSRTRPHAPPSVGSLQGAGQEPGGRSWTLPGGSAPRYRQLYVLIRDRLAKGELRPGDRLPDERRLARLCGVSRMTVRGAFALLGAEGVIRRRTRVGTIVCDSPANSATCDDGFVHSA